MRCHVLPGALLIVCAACRGGPRSVKPPAKPEAPALDVREPWADPETDWPRRTPATRRDRATATTNPRAQAIVIRGATIMTATGQTIANGTIVLANGAISYVGDKPPPAPDGARVVDASGKFVTPGVIDAHSHIGVY